MYILFLFYFYIRLNLNEANHYFNYCCATFHEHKIMHRSNNHGTNHNISPQ